MNLIISCLCYSDGWDSGNLKDDDRYDVYLKNAFVCLKSAKLSNPECKCVLFVNKMPPSSYVKLFRINSIDISVVPFTYYIFDEKYKWALAYYKLNVLKHLNSGCINFSSLILLDNDVYVKDSLDNIFEDTKKRIMLYDLGRRLNSPEYNVFLNDLRLVFGDAVFPSTLYGGEFIGINSINLPILIDEFDHLYHNLKEREIRLMSGDEFFISLFAEKNRTLIMNSSNYIGRYWTGLYRIHSENSGYDYVKILHCPSEKKYGFIKLFKLLKKGRKITNKKAYKLLHLYHGHIHIPTMIWSLKEKIKKKNDND